MKIKLNYNVKSSKRNYFSEADLSKFRLANKLIKRGNISAKDVNKLLNFSIRKIGHLYLFEVKLVLIILIIQLKRNY
jgi:hypothetical protein